MQGKRGAFLFALLVLTNLTGFNLAMAQTPLAEGCFPASEVKELATHFEQIRPFLQGDQPICKDQVGDKWIKLIESLIDLKNIRLGDEREFKTKDDFSFKAIQDNKWWEYFTNRADRFILEGSLCRPGTVAYVHPFLMGVVNLCPGYYESGRITRAEVLLHEVRHFEGYGHVTCTRGPDKGVRGACDTKLELKGSYAVSMQANVTLGLRGQNFSEGERALGRASALYLLQARFNEETELKIKKSLYLETASGDIFEWLPQDGAQLNYITTLKEPAKFYTASMEAIIYPMDTHLPAYRMADDFSISSPRLGMYADKYNAKSETERKSVIAHGYNTNGGFLTETGYFSLCSHDISELKKEEFPEPLTTILTLDVIEQSLVDYVVGESGQLYSVDCSSDGKISLKSQDTYVPRDLLRGAIIGNQRYALTINGELFEMRKEGNKFSLVNRINFSEQNEKWVEMAIRTMPYLFEEAKPKQNEFTLGSAR